MDRMNDKKLTDLAVSILSQLPSHTVEAFSGDGGVVAIDLRSQDGVHIVAEVPRLRVRGQLDLLVRTNELHGGGYDIALNVAEMLYESEWMATVNLRVLDVRRRESERTTPRAAVEELALVHVLGARGIAQSEEFDVRLADLSPSGVAFITDRTFHIGDTLAMMVTIDGHVLRLQARVLQTAMSYYGRQRVGNEILQITDQDRRRISSLTAVLPHTGSASQRLRPTG
jgi:hypothetical protein